MKAQTRICTGIQRINTLTKRGKKYRARKRVNGVEYELRTNNLAEAKKWLKSL